jgi:hypothetical protein
MARVIPYVVGGLAAVLLMDLGPSMIRQAGLLVATPSAAATVMQTSNAARKGDRASRPAVQAAAPEIATVEVVGLRQPAIVYRDRDGRELYRTDPVNNVTIVIKDLLLPEVTVRERGASNAPVVVPVESTPKQPPQPRPAPPVGCEPSFSPVAAPTLSHLTGRCMAMRTTTKLALVD